MDNETRQRLLWEAQAELCKRSLKTFVVTFWPVIEPAPFQDGWYIDAICEHLEAVANGQIRQLLINLPPRHSKSLLAVFFSAWQWAKNPTVRFLCASYALQLSIRDNVKARRIIESDSFRGMFCHGWKITTDQNRKEKFENSRGGYRLACSLEGSTLGEGADCQLIDDPNNIQEMGSNSYRQKVIDWYVGIMTTRLNDPTTGTRVMIQQRCHEEDLTGYLLANHPEQWTRLVLPYEYNSRKTLTTSIGWSDPRTKEGQLLSQRIPESEIPFYRRQLGTYQYSAQYLQEPIPADGTVFKLEWMKKFPPGPDYLLDNRKFSADSCRRFASVDLAISTKTTADFTVIGVFDVTPDKDLILVHMLRQRLDGTKLLPAIKAIHAHYQPAYFVVEDVAFQRLFITQCRKEGLPIRAFRPEADKLSRSLPLQIRMEAGQVWFPSQQWVGDIERELLGFPSAPRDDIVDMFSQAAIDLNRQSSGRVYLPPTPPEQPPQPKLMTWEDVLRMRDNLAERDR